MFDLDGTLIDSQGSVLRAWHAAAEHVGLPFEDFEQYTHGIPAQQAFAMVVPDAAPADIEAWSQRLLVQQAEDTGDVVATAGAIEALRELPSSRWAIVTSGDLRLATARMAAARIPSPRVLVTADDVTVGKPDPAPYLMAAAKLSVASASCLVFEDVWAGIESAHAAGMPVVGVLSSADSLPDADHTIADFTGVSFEADRLGVTVTSRSG